MLRQELRSALRIGAFESPKYGGMNATPFAEEKAVGGGVAHQRVLEGVGRIRRLAAAKDELGAGQALERALQFRRRDREQRAVIELAADAGRELGDALDLRHTV